MSLIHGESYIGHLGRQDYDDTLAYNAEYTYITFDYTKLEQRVLARLVPQPWYIRLWHKLWGLT